MVLLEFKSLGSTAKQCSNDAAAVEEEPGWSRKQTRQMGQWPSRGHRVHVLTAVQASEPTWEQLSGVANLACAPGCRLCPRRASVPSTGCQSLICLKCVHPQSCRLPATPWTVARQDTLSRGFSRQEHWSGLPFSSPGGSSGPRDGNHVTCLSRQILYHGANYLKSIFLNLPILWFSSIHKIILKLH